jgi:hypothetical protein
LRDKIGDVTVNARDLFFSLHDGEGTPWGGELPTFSEEVAVQVLERNPTVPGFNEQLRESSEIVAKVDKGFRHYIKYFRSELPVTAAIRVEKGHHGDYGWGVYFEQGRHRCVLAGTVVDRP